MSSSTSTMLASARYPVTSSMYPEQRARNLRLRADYIHALDECKSNPAYYVILPTGENHPVSSYPLMEDDTKGWTTIKRKIHVKRIKTEEELEWEAAQMHDPWEAESVDSQNYVLPSGEHNGALFDIGARF